MSKTQKTPSILVIGTGGTIAGRSLQDGGYLAGQLPIEAVLGQIQCDLSIKNKQLCNIDSCDLTESWLTQLGNELVYQLQEPEVAGIVVTHGTDTMEETAIFLDCICAQRSRDMGKKVVLTGAMLPSDHPSADGPKNLLNAIQFAANQAVNGGIWAMMGSKPIRGCNLIKGHSSSLEAFIEESMGNFPDKVSEDLPIPPQNHWPWVEIVTSHSGAKPNTIRSWQSEGVKGIVVAGTGAGTVHEDLCTPLERFIEAGGAVIRSSRIGRGSVTQFLSNGRLKGSLPAGSLSPAKARIALQLALYASVQSNPKALSWQDFFARISGLPEKSG